MEGMRMLVAAMVLLTLAREALAVEYLKFGGANAPWVENALVVTALKKIESSLAALEADPDENIMIQIGELGGRAVSSITAFGQSLVRQEETGFQQGNDILPALIDGDPNTGWRVFTNTNGAELRIDMGAVFVLHRIFMRRGVLDNDNQSLRGYEIYANDGDSTNFIGAEPVFALIAQNRTHGDPELDVRFAPQPVRFLKVRSTGERPFSMGDLEVFGTGVTPFARYVSRVIDLGAPANFGPVQIAARIDPDAEVLFATKTGTVPDDSLYFRQTGIPGKFAEVPKSEFSRNLNPRYAGFVRENDREWSAWSPPYAALESPLNSPDNRQYLQFEFRLISNGLLDQAIIDSLTIPYTVPAIADSVLGEISPITAVLGEQNRFTYHLRAVISGDKRGFDTVFITTPFPAKATAVEVDGQGVDFTQEATDRQLQVVFPDGRIEQNGQEVAIHFESLVTVSGTEFRSEVGDSQSDAFPQRVIGGDAHQSAAGNSLTVGGTIEDRLFTGIHFSSSVITPNGDNTHDELKLNYTLLKITSPVEVQVTTHSLIGTPVRSLYNQMDLSGPQEIRWDGRDDEGRLVPPGLYLIRITANTDAGENTQLRPVAVVY